MSITALAVEALPGSTCLDAVRERIDTDLSQLASASVQGAPNPLDLAAWARASEARLSAFRLSALAEAERQGAARTKGALGTAAWLKGQGQGAAAARRDVTLAGSLADPEHEATRDMLAAGRIMPEQALVVTEATDALSDQVSPEKRAEFVAGLLAQAQTLDPSHLFTAAKRAAARVDPTGSGDLAKAEKAARSQRAFTMYPKAGMYVLTGQVDAEGAAYLSAALDPLSAPRATSIDGADERSPAHRRCDALVELSRRQIASGDLPDIGGVPTLVVVTMTLDQLTGPVAAATTDDAGERCAELVGGTIREPISAGRARRLACHAGLLPAVLGGDSHILDWGHTQRLATPAQRRALALRDQGCTFSGCDRPPSWCETHHTVPFGTSGRTRLDELALVCDAHHDLAHTDKWTLTLTPDGIHWTPRQPDPPPQAEPP